MCYSFQKKPFDFEPGRRAKLLRWILIHALATMATHSTRWHIAIRAGYQSTTGSVLSSSSRRFLISSGVLPFSFGTFTNRT